MYQPSGYEDRRIPPVKTIPSVCNLSDNDIGKNFFYPRGLRWFIDCDRSRKAVGLIICIKYAFLTTIIVQWMAKPFINDFSHGVHVPYP